MERYCLEDVCSVITDGTHQTPVYSDEGYIFLSSKDVTSRKINWDTSKKIPKELHEKLYARLKPQVKDILLAKNGTTGVAALVDREEVFDIYVSLALLRPKENVLPEYLLYAINSPAIKRQFERSLKGIGVPNLHLNVIRKTRVPIPLLNRQKEIHAVLCKTDELLSRQQMLLKELDNLVKSRFIELFGDPETNTKGWSVVPMCDVCSVGSSKRIYQSEQSSDGVPFWRISDLTNLINTGIATATLYIPDEKYFELLSQEQVPLAGDILVTSRGTLGQCYIVKEDDKFYFQDGMISWLSKYTKNITPLYISYLFAMPGFRKQIDSMQAGSTVAYLSIAMIKKLEVMVPDFELQKQFEAFVAQIDKSKLNNTFSLNL